MINFSCSCIYMWFFWFNCELQTLNIISISFWIVHVFIHVCWCSSDTSSHLREAPPYLMSSWYHHTILYPCLIVVAQWWRLSPSMTMRNLVGKFSQNSSRVCKFTICSMYVQFWSNWTCHFSIMNAIYLIYFYFYFVLEEKYDVPSQLHNYPITIKSCGSNLNTIML